jgi:nucleotidyltransferase/DNA polymerase involved in DNA repair
VVLSNNDGRVIARSNEAKALGVEIGAPWHLHREKFAHNGIIIRSSNYTLYGDMSARVMRTLGGFTPRLEIYSIDKACRSRRASCRPPFGIGGAAGWSRGPGSLAFHSDVRDRIQVAVVHDQLVEPALAVESHPDVRCEKKVGLLAQNVTST